MNKNLIVKNYLYTLMYQILIILTPIITTPYISRVIGAQGIGIYSFTLTISIYFITFGSLGLPLYGQREVAYNKDDLYLRSKLFSEIFILQIILLIISLSLYLYYFVLQDNQYNKIFLIQSIGIFASIIDVSWLLTGLEEFRVIVVRNIFIKLSSILLVFIFVKTEQDLWIYTLCMGLSNLLGNLSVLVTCNKFIVKVKSKDINLIKHLKPAIILMLPYGITKIYNFIGKTIMGFYGNTMAEIGFYEQSHKIIGLSIAIVTSLGTVIMPQLAFEYANSESNQNINRYLKKILIFVSFITLPIMFGLIAISDSFVPWFFGPGFEKVSLLIKIQSPLAVLMGINNIIGAQYLIALGKEKKYAAIIFLGTMLNLLLNFLLIPRYESLGASVALVCSELFISTVYFSIIRKEILVINIYKHIIKYSIMSFIMYMSIDISSAFIPINNRIINTSFLVVVGVFVYCLLLFIIKDRTFKQIINVVASRLPSRRSNN